MRLIDADALYEEIYDLRYTKESPSVIFTEEGQEIFNCGIGAACCVVAQSNTIDAVPVVRCKDCENSQPIYDADCVWCNLRREEMQRNGFCHEGVRGESHD